MSKINELRDYLLENYVNEQGDLYICGLDFSDFDGDVAINGMRVKGNLHQEHQDVKGDLYQSSQEVKGNLMQDGQKVDGVLWQSSQEVGGNLWQGFSEIKGNYTCEGIKVGGDIYTNEPKKLLKKVTRKELSEMGYEVID